MKDSRPGHRVKEFLKNLQKRDKCYLKISKDSSGRTVVVDDVGCVIANVCSFRLENNSMKESRLTIEILNPDFEITTQSASDELF